MARAVGQGQLTHKEELKGRAATEWWQPGPRSSTSPAPMSNHRTRDIPDPTLSGSGIASETEPEVEHGCAGKLKTIIFNI